MTYPPNRASLDRPLPGAGRGEISDNEFEVTQKRYFEFIVGYNPSPILGEDTFCQGWEQGDGKPTGQVEKEIACRRTEPIDAPIIVPVSERIGKEQDQDLDCSLRAWELRWRNSSYGWRSYHNLHRISSQRLASLR